MGITPIPSIRPPRPSRLELFRREITPPPDRVTPVIGWCVTLLGLALVVLVPLAVLS